MGLPVLAFDGPPGAADPPVRPVGLPSPNDGAPRPVDGRAYRVAIVDDNDRLRTLYRTLLDADPRFDVVGEAADGVEALEVVRAHDPEVLLLDLAMPRLDGIEVLAALRAQRRPVRVVVYTGYDTPTLRARATALGVSAFVPKGHAPEAVLGAVAAAGDEARNPRA